MKNTISSGGLFGGRTKREAAKVGRFTGKRNPALAGGIFNALFGKKWGGCNEGSCRRDSGFRTHTQAVRGADPKKQEKKIDQTQILYDHADD